MADVTPPPAKRRKQSHSSAGSDGSDEQSTAFLKTPSTFGNALDKFKFSSTTPLSPSRRSPRLRKLPANLGENTATQEPSPIKRLRNTPVKSIKNEGQESPNQSPQRSTPSTPKQRTSSKYAAPSKYAHLNPLTDTIIPNLLLVFVGVNPGITTAQQGHAYAHPSNLFWRLLHTSTLTSIRHPASIDRDLPWLYGYGHTNIVSRPTKDQAELSRAEMVAGTAILEEKFRRFRPEAVVLVGKGIWEAVWEWRYGRKIRKEEFRYGWQAEKENMGRIKEGEVVDGVKQEAEWRGSRVFVATSTSGQAASTRPEEKEAVWKMLGDWARRRREEGYVVPGRPDEEEMKIEEKEVDVAQEDMLRELLT